MLIERILNYLRTNLVYFSLVEATGGKNRITTLIIFTKFHANVKK